MKSKQTMFFLTKEDFSPIVEELENNFKIHYYRTGLMDNRLVPEYNSIFDFKELGFTSFGDWNLIDSFLIIPDSEELKIEDIPQRNGGVKYAVDQRLNAKSIQLKPGGVYKDLENVIVAGRIATISEDSFSSELYNFFSKKIKKEFKQIGSFYIGKDAEDKLDKGWRLVTNAGSPREYDLVKQ